MSPLPAIAPPFEAAASWRGRVLPWLQHSLPGLLAVYGFGSRITGQARADSDLDLAVLVAGYADPVQLFELAGELADRVGCEVDLLDMRAASTVMQHQILSTGLRLWSADPLVEIWEAGVLNDKLDLDQARAGLMRDIEREGRIHGR